MCVSGREESDENRVKFIKESVMFFSSNSPRYEPLLQGRDEPDSLVVSVSVMSFRTIQLMI